MPAVLERARFDLGMFTAPHLPRQDFAKVVDCVDNMNTTPLMHASAFGFPDLVKLLLKC